MFVISCLERAVNSIDRAWEEVKAGVVGLASVGAVSLSKEMSHRWCGFQTVHRVLEMDWLRIINHLFVVVFRLGNVEQMN